MAQAFRCDVAIIGAGTAGLSAERSARRAGASTLLIDPAFNGTTCATVGCMPSKLLIEAALAAHAAKRAAALGVMAEPVIDGPAVLRRVREQRDAFAEATRREIGKLPDGVRLEGKARFTGPTTLAVTGGHIVEATAIVIATGSKPAVPASFDAVKPFILTNETVFDLADLPASLAVVGAGPLGLELAQAMARLGVAVTLLDRGGQIAGLHDTIVSDRLKDVLSRDMAIHLGVEIEAETAQGHALLRWSGGSKGEGRFDHVLIAAGRPPQLDGLDLDRAGIALDEEGVPLFDRETMRCGSSAIYIAGDADAERPVLHEASGEGAIAGSNAAHHPDAKPGHRCVPFSIMFTDPPLALVGRREGDALVTGDADYRDQGKAKVEDRAEGIARLHAEPGDGRLVGATLFCPDADHLGHLLAWSIETGATTRALLDRPFYHPTIEEGLKPALRSICSQIGLASPATRDEGVPAGA